MGSEIATPPGAASAASSTLDDAIAEVQRRSSVDGAFRRLALNDASAAISLVSEISIPEGVNIQFVDNSGPVKIVPLPATVSGIEENEPLLESNLSDIRGFDVSGWLSWSR